MRKLILNLTLVFLVLLLSSCALNGKTPNTENTDSTGGSRTDMLNKEDEGKIAIARLEQIIEAINNQDKNMIKEMFSEQAQSEAKDLDGGIDYLFTLIEGNIESWEKIGGSVDESTNEGHTTTKFRYRFNVYTDKEQYSFSILEYTKDADNPKNIGLYCLKVINAKDEEPVFSDAGIYRPEE